MSSKRDKIRFLRVTVDGVSCICEPHEAVDLMDESEEYTVTEVFMTQAEYDAMPEFQGW